MGSPNGIFNFLIFVGHKAYDMKTMDPQLSLRKSIIRVLIDREEKKQFSPALVWFALITKFILTAVLIAKMIMRIVSWH